MSSHIRDLLSSIWKFINQLMDELVEIYSHAYIDTTGENRKEDKDKH
ncbi:MAG: hypothetical protein ACHQ1D_04585 [Nitrososphaerales archaeon]|jgi:hypothetical protein